MDDNMKIGEKSTLKGFRIGFLVLGIIAALGLLGYGLSYIIVMPKVSPDGFVPKILGASDQTNFGFGTVLAIFVLLYAFTFLPVNIMFTVKKYHTNPYALILASCLIYISLIIEIINNLPIVAIGIYPSELKSISPDILLYLRQVETIRFLSFDVAGFMVAYVATFIYSIVYFRSNRLLSYTIIGSIIAFIANVPCLWFAPKASVILMVISIFAFALVPVFLAKMAIE